MRAGEIIANRFEIERLAGAGGMGEVYRARDQLDGSAVALKLRGAGGGKAPERFEREAKVLAELRHARIVRYIASGLTTEGQPYLVMEWLEGEDLTARLKRQRLTLAESVALALHVAEALSLAHARGVVHRDIKPSNVFLPDGDVARVKVLDFGIARWDAATKVLTQTGLVVGTPGYMAPEQARGVVDIDARADVFSLGCVLFECIAGRPPFVADHAVALLGKIMMESAPKLDGIPDEISVLLRKMMAKVPADRPSSAEALLDPLRSLASAIGHTSQTPSAPAEPSVSLTGEEHKIVSAILCTGWAARAPTEVARGAQGNAQTVAADRASSPLAQLAKVASKHGVRLEALADGSLLGVLSGPGAATDLALRGVRCALELSKHLGDAPLVVATGRAVIGTQGRVGEVLDRAATLAGVAGHTGTVRVDEVTAGLLDARFDVSGDEAGLLVRGERDVDTGRRLLGKKTPCVGRNRELATLEATLHECVDESVARVVLVTGPAGIGKSRVRYELTHRIRDSDVEPELWLARGDPINAGSPFGMAARIVRRACAVVDGEPDAIRQSKLRARIARNVTPEHAERVTRFLAELVGAPFETDADLQLAAARQDPVVMGDQIRRAFEDFIEAECRHQPVVIVLEDLQWGDEPSLALVDRVLRNLAELPLFIVALARPELNEAHPRLWSDRGLLQLQLGGLSRKAAEKLVRASIGEDVSAERVNLLVERANGNAFFLEELVRAAAAGQWGSLPDTVLAVTQTRLSSLQPEARRILQVASVFGGTFWQGGLAAILGTNVSSATLGDWLEVLSSQELVGRAIPPQLAGQAEYRFRHALLREAAYDMLSAEDKAAAHKLAGEWLEGLDADALTLAEHYRLGNAHERAVKWYVQAGRDALEASDSHAALACGNSAVDCGASGVALGLVRAIQAEAHGWLRQEEEAQQHGREALSALPSGSPEWLAAITEVISQCGAEGRADALLELWRTLNAADADTDSPAFIRATAQAATYLYVAGENSEADRAIADLEQRLATSAGENPAVRCWVFRARGVKALWDGEPARYAQQMHAAVEAYTAAGDLRLACKELANEGFGLIELGAFDEAIAAYRQTLSSAKRMGLISVTSNAWIHLGLALGLVGQFDESARFFDLSRPFYRPGTRLKVGANTYEARVLLAAGALHRAHELASTATAETEELPEGLRADTLAILAFAKLELGDRAGAWNAASEAAALLDKVGRIEEGVVRIRLAYAKAAHATERRDEARTAITLARDFIQERAARIEQAGWRQSFLENVPENREALARAVEWLG